MKEGGKKPFVCLRLCLSLLAVGCWLLYRISTRLDSTRACGTIHTTRYALFSDEATWQALGLLTNITRNTCPVHHGLVPRPSARWPRFIAMHAICALPAVAHASRTAGGLRVVFVSVVEERVRPANGRASLQGQGRGQALVRVMPTIECCSIHSPCNYYTVLYCTVLYCTVLQVHDTTTTKTHYHRLPILQLARGSWELGVGSWEESGAHTHTHTNINVHPWGSKYSVPCHLATRPASTRGKGVAYPYELVSLPTQAC